MKLKRSLLYLLTAACLLLAAAAPALAEGTSDSSTDISPEKFDLFQECFTLAHPSVELISIDKVRSTLGDVAANQYAGAVNYFYDTGDTDALGGMVVLLGGTNIPMVMDYVPGSASPASATPVTEAPFPDVPTDAWYAKAVSEMKDSGIIEGCDDGLFHPERPVTIGELYAMVLRAITTPTFDVTVATGVSNDTHWANGVLKNAARAYLWPPKEPGHADDYVLRSEAACRTVLAHYYAESSGQYKAGWTWSLARERTVGNMTLADIPDHATIERYLDETTVYRVDAESILFAYNYGITKGVDAAGTFNPYGTLTRAEVAQFLYNARLTERTGGIKDSLLQ